MKINQVKFGALLSYVVIVLNMVIGVLYTPILTSKLGQSEYGLYSLVTTVISYLTILDFGFGNAIIIYTAKYRASKDKENEEKLHGMFLIIYTIIGLIAGLIGVILCFNVDKLFGATMTATEINKSRILMGILALNLVITFSFSIFSYIITAYEKFIFSKILNIIRIAINPIIMIILLNMGYKSIALVIVTTILNALVLFINFIYCKTRLKIKFRFGKFDKVLLKAITALSIWVFLNSIIDKVNWTLDQFVLGIVSGTTEVAIYSVASHLITMYINFSIALSGVLLPRIAMMEEKSADDKEYTDLFIRTGRLQYILMALVTTGFLLYGREFINILWVGPEYDKSYFIALIMMIPTLIPLIQNVGLNILQVKNQYKFRVIALFLLAIFNVGISIILAKIYGGIGAAIGTTIVTILGAGIFMNIFYYKKTKIDIPLFWKNIIKLTIPVAISVVVGYLLKNFIHIDTAMKLAFEIVVYTGIYVVLIWILGMNKYEKNLILNPLKKVFKKEEVQKDA